MRAPRIPGALVRTGAIGLMMLAFALGADARTPRQVQIVEGVSQSQTTASQLSGMIVANAQAAAKEAAQSAYDQAAPVAMAAYGNTINQAWSSYNQSVAASYAQLQAALQAASAQLAMSQVTYTSSYRACAFCSRRYTTRSYTPQSAYDAYYAAVNAAYNAHNARWNAAYNGAIASINSAFQSYQTTISTAVSQAVQTAVTESIAETVSEAGVSAGVAASAVGQAIDAMASPAFAQAALAGTSAQWYVSPSVIQNASRSAGQTIVTAVQQAANPVVTGSTNSGGNPSTPPPTPLVIVYRG